MAKWKRLCGILNANFLILIAAIKMYYLEELHVKSHKIGGKECEVMLIRHSEHPSRFILMIKECSAGL